MHVLVIGKTRFIGRHTVADLLDSDHTVTLLNRGEHDDPFADDDRTDRVEGDRTDRNAVETAAAAADPDAVIDIAAYHPDEVRAATEVFAGVDAYVYVSSTAAYREAAIPKREDETPLEPCTDEQATDDSRETYAARKAEGDRVVFEAAEAGVNAVSARLTRVYGPYDYYEVVDYWIDRVANHDRVVVPGDGTNLSHRVYAEDAASALRRLAEDGEPGLAYNVGDRRLTTLSEFVGLIADALDTAVEVVPATDRELSAAGLSVGDFPLYRDYPHVLDTGRIETLGWESTPVAEAVARTVEESLESDRDGRDRGPAREAEERVLGVLDTL